MHARRFYFLKPPTNCLVLGLGIAWMLSSLYVLGQNGPDEIAELITRLNDRRFAVRTAATEELTNRGVDVLKPLVDQTLDMGPEALWRAQKIVENIGMAGNEDTFVKTAAILRTLAQHQQIDQTLAQLELSWKSGQTKRAVQHLRQLGAQVNLRELADSEFEEFMFIDPFRSFSEEPIAAETEANRTQTVSKLTPAEQRQQIDAILTGDLSQNYKIAFPSRAFTNTKSGTDLRRARAVHFNQQFAQRRILLANGLLVGNHDGDSVTLDKNWRGTPEDFQQVAIINGLSTVIFRELEVTSDYLQPLQRIVNLGRLRFEGCSLPPSALQDIGQLRHLPALELIKVELTDEAVQALVPLRNLSEIVLELSSESQSAWWHQASEFRSVSSLVLRRMQLEDQHFVKLETMAALSSVFLEGCSFNIQTYKEFKRLHPEVSFEFVPKAYLGVRSDFGANQNMRPCLIGEVVPGTGAAEAGMQTGDIVLKIAGQEIEAFEDLRLIVAQFEANDVVDVIVQRRGEQLNLKIRLGDRAAVNQ